MILNAGVVRKSGPNNLNSFLARRFAENGYTAFRFDFAGVGDSPNRQDRLPLKEGVLQDITECLDVLEGLCGTREFVLLGLCSGADNGLRAARVEAGRVVGLVMLDPTVFRTKRWYLVKVWKRAASIDFWKSLVLLRHRWIGLMRDRVRGREPVACDLARLEEPELYTIGLQDRREISECLREVRERGVRLCFAFTGGWSEIYNYRTQLFHVYPELHLKEDAEVLFFPEASHTFMSDAHREALASALLRWLEGDHSQRLEPEVPPAIRAVSV
ncbi:alpha/beta fold hydrolase [Thiocapsa marina]|uniref:alpha/beta fold hydrolase n=1 Tax=Thiocapsa marina TaxID=244573 RepID=UPI0002F08BF2|nr:alpha/beta fold hydrolase [Thiocapsa marina]